MKNNKAENLREKLKQALTSTARVISDDIHLKTIDEKNKKDLNFVDIENLNSKRIYSRRHKYCNESKNCIALG